MNELWIILTGALVAVNCAILGSFLLLRRMAMLGDAISHSALPGIAIAYLLSSSLSTTPLLLGAALVALLSVSLIELLQKKVGLQADASMGISYSFLFAIGVILVSAFAQNTDLDQECLLYGDIAYIPFELFITQSGLNLGPEALWWQGGALLVNAAVIYFAYRAFFVTSFDPSFASGLGISTRGWHYLLMCMVAITVVFSFRVVGAILVLAFLVVPPATAFLLTRRLQHMLILSIVFGIVSAVMGFLVAEWWQSSIAGSMALFTGLIFVLVFLFLMLKKSWLSTGQTYSKLNSAEQASSSTRP